MEWIVIAGYIVVLLAVILRLLKSKGWDWKPMLYEDGTFQVNTILTVIFGFVGALAYMNTAQLVAVQGIELQVGALWVLFTAVYGTPAVLDAVGTVLTPTPAEAGA